MYKRERLIYYDIDNKTYKDLNSINKIYRLHTHKNIYGNPNIQQTFYDNFYSHFQDSQITFKSLKELNYAIANFENNYNLKFSFNLMNTVFVSDKFYLFKKNKKYDYKSPKFIWEARPNRKFIRENFKKIIDNKYLDLPTEYIENIKSFKKSSDDDTWITLTKAGQIKLNNKNILYNSIDVHSFEALNGEGLTREIAINNLKNKALKLKLDI